jgi:hypothetical protein
MSKLNDKFKEFEEQNCRVRRRRGRIEAARPAG